MTHSNVVPVPLIVSTSTDELKPTALIEPTVTISPHYSIGIYRMTHSNVVPVTLIVSTSTDEMEPTALIELTVTISPHYSNDIGIAVNNRRNLSVAEKLELIQNPFIYPQILVPVCPTIFPLTPG